MKPVVFFDLSGKIGGAEISLLELCRSVDFPVKVACPAGSDMAKRLTAQGGNVHELPLPALSGKGTFFSKVSNRLKAGAIRKAISEGLCGGEPGIFIANTVVADYYSGTVMQENSWVQICCCRDAPTGIKSKYLKKRDCVIAPSEWIYTKLRELGVTAELAVNGVDIDYFTSETDTTALKTLLNLPDVPVIGFAAQFIKRKGFDRFIQVASELHGKHPEWAYLIAGSSLYDDSTYEDELKEKSERAGLGSVCRFTGALSDMRAFYKLCDLFISFSRHEPFGRTPVESSLCGALPLVPYEGGYLETFGSIPDLFITRGDPVAVPGIIESLILDNEKRSRLLEKAKTRALEFDIRKTAARYTEILETL